MAPEDYEITVDSKHHHSGTRSGLIRAIKNPPSDFGTLMQMFIPDEYRGKRVRLTGWIRTQNASISSRPR